MLGNLEVKYKIQNIYIDIRLYYKKIILDYFRLAIYNIILELL